jgi:hypothetical protein
MTQRLANTEYGVLLVKQHIQVVGVFSGWDFGHGVERAGVAIVLTSLCITLWTAT